jgi:hypothetical protein
LQRSAALGPREQFARQRIGRTVTPVPAAAFAVASASNAPGRGSSGVALSGVALERQVMQT